VERFRERIAALRPDLADRVDAIGSLDDLHWLDVRLDRLQRWYIDGLLCIGDAAHAMSPAGGVGINLAIQDAVAAAARLAPALLRGKVTVQDLAAVQRRRQLPTVIIQSVQRLMHRGVFIPLFTGKRSGPPAAVMYLARHVPVLMGLLPRMIAHGPLPEHAPAFARRMDAGPGKVPGTD
jgi:2-polyprenyl-6-methoxyphenol hydroxylase-like FAD-dependent oxidoreductase